MLMFIAKEVITVIAVALIAAVIVVAAATFIALREEIKRKGDNKHD